MALSDFVNVSISLTPQTLTRPGFGTPLLLAADAPAGFTNRVREYTDVDGLVADGFSTSGPTYLMALAIVSQNPRPPSFKVGRLALPPTMHFTITPTAQNSTVYSMVVAGQAVSITSDGSATATEIVTALKTVIDALSISGLTTGGTTTLTLTMGSAGQFLDVSVGDRALLSMAQDQSDPGSSTDLDAITVEDANWYGILNAFNSKAIIVAIATWAEAHEKLFVAQTSDSACAQHVLSGATDVMATLQASSRFWSSAWFSPSTGDFLDAAEDGALLPTDPGSETWGLKTLSGPVAGTYTATERANILAKNGNLYERIGNISFTSLGKVASGEWIDVVRFRDWLKANIQADAFDALRGANIPLNGKLPFTDAGIAVVQGAIKAVLRRGLTAGGLAADPAPTVTVPKAADISPSDKAARRLTGVKFTATLAGAIQSATITGVLSV